MNTLTKLTSLRHQLASISGQINYDKVSNVDELNRQRESLLKEYKECEKQREIEKNMLKHIVL